MKTSIAIILSTAVSSTAWAQSVEAPVVQVGDSWVYRDTTERGPAGWAQTRDEITVSRTTGTSIYYSAKPSGSLQAPREMITAIDWSLVRNIDGVDTTINRPLSFPLRIDKSWTIDYTNPHPTNKTHRSEQSRSVYKVVGYEPVEVPAGKFNALKIEAEGTWATQLEPGSTVLQSAQTSPAGVSMATTVQKTSPDTLTGRTYKAFWYAPEVKRWVKSVEEYYSTTNIRSERFTSELESFKPASPTN